jgi:lipopolysaccharide biosynthesis regulator YciM
MQGKYAEAEPLYKRSLKILEKAFGPDHPHVATVLENMAELYKKMGKEDEVKRFEERAKKIRSKYR